MPSELAEQRRCPEASHECHALPCKLTTPHSQNNGRLCGRDSAAITPETTVLGAVVADWLASRLLGVSIGRCPLMGSHAGVVL